jgi:hypothetical protein
MTGRASTSKGCGSSGISCHQPQVARLGMNMPNHFPNNKLYDRNGHILDAQLMSAIPCSRACEAFWQRGGPAAALTHWVLARRSSTAHRAGASELVSSTTTSKSLQHTTSATRTTIIALSAGPRTGTDWCCDRRQAWQLIEHAFPDLKTHDCTIHAPNMAMFLPRMSQDSNMPSPRRSGGDEAGQPNLLERDARACCAVWPLASLTSGLLSASHL